MGLQRKQLDARDARKARASVFAKIGGELDKVTDRLPAFRSWLLEYLDLGHDERKRKFADLLPTLNSADAEATAWLLDCAKEDWYAHLLRDILRRRQKEKTTMKKLGLLIAVATLGLTMMMAGCGGADEGSGVNWPTPPDVTGVWQGTFSDTRGSGTLLVVLTDQGRNVMPANVSGTLNMSYRSGMQNGGPVGAGSSLIQNTSDQYVATFAVIFSTPGRGANLFQGIISPDLATISGTLSGDWSRGTFELTRQ